MKTSFWNGVIPALTTPIKPDGSVDHAFLARHAAMMIDAGCTAIVPLGSLGETATLTLAEKKAVIEAVVKSVGMRAAVITGIAALSTEDAIGVGAHVGGGGRERPHGAAALRLLERLARDEAPCRGGDPRNAAPMHALQQPDRRPARLRRP